MSDGPVLLITGSTGIAEATALLAGERGYRVFAAGMEESSLRGLCERVPEAAWLSGDLRDEAFSEAAVRACVERFSGVDSLFNVAGISGRRFGDGPLHECSVEGWQVTLDSNVKSMFLMCRAALRYWLGERKPGAILNMASVLAFAPEAEHFASHAYAASKGAVISMSQSMAAYYAPLKIRVNAIAPALVRTPMSARAQSDEEIVEFVRCKQPLSGGMLEACDVARAALFLLGEDSRPITGQVLAVDGGWSVSG
jgi:NAD(P)-dependent dehydrogenase (short-subunit alcohol dehydrogenase family)